MKNNEIKLLFFGHRPESMAKKPPLASSLQNFETALILFSQARYPHALISLASAIESSMKAILRKSKHKRLQAYEIYREISQSYPFLKKYTDEQQNNFRKARNTFIHYGFIPNDDEKSAYFALDTGIPILMDCYREFFGFELSSALHPDLQSHLENMIEVFQMNRGKKGIKSSKYFSVLNHQIYWDFLQSKMSDIISNSISRADESGLVFEEQVHKKENVQRHFKDYWNFTCPVCAEYESFVCELSFKEEKIKEISFRKGYCVNCDLFVPDGIPMLLDTILEDQLATEKDGITEGYGIC